MTSWPQDSISLFSRFTCFTSLLNENYCSFLKRYIVDVVLYSRKAPRTTKIRCSFIFMDVIKLVFYSLLYTGVVFYFLDKIFTFVPCILILSSFIYSPTGTQVSCFKNNIKIRMCGDVASHITTHRCILMDCFINCNFSKHE